MIRHGQATTAATKAPVLIQVKQFLRDNFKLFVRMLDKCADHHAFLAGITSRATCGRTQGF